MTYREIDSLYSSLDDLETKIVGIRVTIIILNLKWIIREELKVTKGKKSCTICHR